MRTAYCGTIPISLISAEISDESYGPGGGFYSITERNIRAVQKLSVTNAADVKMQFYV